VLRVARIGEVRLHAEEELLVAAEPGAPMLRAAAIGAAHVARLAIGQVLDKTGPTRGVRGWPPLSARGRLSGA
jgi:hypothetical protein